MSRAALREICRCGRAFAVFTFPSGRNGIFHCQCPPCEVNARVVCAWLAVLLRETRFGPLLARCAQ